MEKKCVYYGHFDEQGLKTQIFPRFEFIFLG